MRVETLLFFFFEKGIFLFRGNVFKTKAEKSEEKSEKNRKVH